MAMSDDKMLPFERQFDEKPTRISSFTLLTDEQVGVYIHEGRVDMPVWPPDEVAKEIAEKGGEIQPFLMSFTPQEARNLAGLLAYAAGRADEHHDHCPGCGDTVDEDGHHHDEEEDDNEDQG
jgi:hypothetical protein